MTKDSLAEEYAKGDVCHPAKGSYGEHKKSYLAGFEKAIELAVAIANKEMFKATTRDGSATGTRIIQEIKKIGGAE